MIKTYIFRNNVEVWQGIVLFAMPPGACHNIREDDTQLFIQDDSHLVHIASQIDNLNAVDSKISSDNAIHDKKEREQELDIIFTDDIDSKTFSEALKAYKDSKKLDNKAVDSQKHKHQPLDSQDFDSQKSNNQALDRKLSSDLTLLSKTFSPDQNKDSQTQSRPVISNRKLSSEALDSQIKRIKKDIADFSDNFQNMGRSGKRRSRLFDG